MYAELDYRIHFEAIKKLVNANFGISRSSFVRLICFRHGADFFVPLEINGGDEHGTNTSDEPDIFI